MFPVSGALQLNTSGASHGTLPMISQRTEYSTFVSPWSKEWCGDFVRKRQAAFFGDFLQFLDDREVNPAGPLLLGQLGVLFERHPLVG
eukprot:CAMPEP_0167833890 /NCGR_PEP_ID=MMETSP0112_2-20121227/15302_1 /TAXON_ID=91324 /ORGANISM="Lotharella globosa, Strain CCCM811" /LENGTH=87 /DNA_ID=CAMNT_0007739417 /DNA_START=580 /DNA_END=839 /DNA_ORIENTATION=-